MSSLAIPPLNLTAAAPQSGKTKGAAQQFESLLIGQVLHAAHESGSGWLGSPEDSSADSATDFAEQQFADVLAKAGGFGLAGMISRNLDRAAPSGDLPAPAATTAR